MTLPAIEMFIFMQWPNYNDGFTYFELGDGDELWENIFFQNYFEAHKASIYYLKISWF
jgi:hypothetical protein